MPKRQGTESDGIEVVPPKCIPLLAAEWTERKADNLFTLDICDFNERFTRWGFHDLGKTKFALIRSFWDTSKERGLQNCRAVKQIDMCKYQPTVRATIIRRVKHEIEIFKKLQTNRETGMFDDGHPNVVKLHGFYWDGGCSNEMNLTYEICNRQTLKQRWKNFHRNLSEDEARPIIRELASALQFMHERNVIHKDLRMETVIQQYSTADRQANLTGNKICSLDNAAFVNSDEPVRSLICEMPCRFTIWDSVQCSEYLRGMNSKNPTLTYNKSTDVYSLGTILCKLITKADYYGGTECQNHEMYAVKTVNNEPISEVNRFLSYNPYWKACRYCTLRALANRATLPFQRDATFLPRVNGSNLVTDLLSKLLDKDRDSRMKTEDILRHYWFSPPTPSQPNHEPVENLVYLPFPDSEDDTLYNEANHDIRTDVSCMRGAI